MTLPNYPEPKGISTKRKIILYIILAVLFLPISLMAQEWELVWSDEFDGDTIDMEKWSYQTGTGTEYGFTDWGNNELQYYWEQNISVHDGMLHVTAKQESYGGKDYTSGRIRTIDKGDWTFGRFEFRAKMPVGQGLCGAIWMLPTDEVYGGWAASGEIDIVEYLGDDTTRVYGTIHYGGTWPNNQYRGTDYVTDATAFSGDFHIFALEWEEEVIRWYVDGDLYQTLGTGDWYSSQAPFPAPFDQRFHLLLNLAVGGNWPGSPDETTIFPQDLVLDYVRVYQVPNPCDSADINIDAQITQPLCYSGSDGTIDISVTGRYPGFTYSWSNGAISEDIENLSEGVYEIIITDAEGCKDTASITVDTPDPIILNETISEPLCYGDSNGSIKINVSGGIEPYSILWYDNSSLDSISGLSEGCYSVNVTDSNGCLEQENICLSEPDSLILSLTKQDNICFGDSSGTVYMHASGGMPDYQFIWGNSEYNGSLIAGNYSITAQDANNCIVNDSITLVDPEKINISNIIGEVSVEEYQTYTYSVTDQTSFIFHWFIDGGNVISGQGTSVVVVQWGSNGDGSIRAVAESSYGCVSDSVNLNASIGSTGFEIHGGNEFEIYPNPTYNLITIVFKKLRNYTLEVRSANGNLISNQAILDSSYQLDLSQYHKGIYFITISSKDFVTTRKIIKL